MGLEPALHTDFGPPSLGKEKYLGHTRQESARPHLFQYFCIVSALFFVPGSDYCSGWTRLCRTVSCFAELLDVNLENDAGGVCQPWCFSC